MENYKKKDPTVLMKDNFSKKNNTMVLTMIS